jgi:hypothetical protein
LAVCSEPHEVIIAIPKHSGIAEVDSFVEHANKSVGAYQGRLAFDMTWKVYEKGMLVGSGSGANGPSGVSGGTPRPRFSFGSFPVKAGRTYEVVVELGPRFAFLLPASPSVGVDVATAAPSVGLALNKNIEPLFNRIAWALCGIGLIVLAIALWYHHAWSRPSTR